MEGMHLDRAMMRRALELATRGRGYVSPNPMVGAVVADSEGRILGEGWHQRYGEAHAEVNALAQVQEADLSDATLYVTLEPCAHHGRTPPCADHVAASGIKRVVVAMRDPYQLVDGKGNKRMREAGLEVIVGLLENEARKLNESWIHFVKTGLPFVTVKMGQSLDGYIALPGGESQWITGEMAREQVHRMRAGSDAVLVGTRTALHDNPSLTVRHGIEGQNPLRVILDRHLELPADLNVFTDELRESTIVLVGEDVLDHPRAHELRDAGVRMEGIEVEGNPENLQLERVIRRLGNLKITSILVEGGAAVVDTMLAENLVDKLVIFIGPKLLGHGIKSFQRLATDRLEDACTVNIHRVEMVGEDVMVEGYLK